MFQAKILKDSLNPIGNRLTTMELTYPRFIHAEFMTHRMFCIAGDADLEFDLPSGAKGGINRRVHRMTIADFSDKWFCGANRIKSKPKKECDLSWVEENGKIEAARQYAVRVVD